MASGSDVRQGRAYVELYVKNSALVKGLAEAKQRLMAFGGGIATVGKWMMGLGAMMIAPIAAMTARFGAFGSSLNDMAARTGMTVESLSELNYAADQTGASIADVETASKKLSKFLQQVADGGKEATDTLGDLGLTFAEIRGLSPDEQFDLVASKIAAISNPTTRAAMAMQLFGKSGTAILPMIAEMDELRAKARALGATMTTEDAAAADALGDAFDDLKTSIFGVGNGLSASIAPMLTEFFNAATEAVKQVKKWAMENSALIGTILKVAAGIVAAGVGIFAFGKAIVGVGAILGGLQGFIMWVAGGIQMLASVLGMAISPALVIGAALVAAGAGLLYLARNTAIVQAVGDAIAGFVGGIRDMIATVVNDAMQAWDGIAAALSVGDLQGAIKVITAAISLEWARAVGMFQEVWQGFVRYWNDATTGLAMIFVDSIAAIKTAWAEMIGWMSKKWNDLAASIGQNSIFADLMSRVLKLGGLEISADSIKNLSASQQQPNNERIDAETKNRKASIEKDRKAQQDILTGDNVAANAATGKAIAEAQKGVDDAKRELDAVVKSAKDKRDAARAMAAKDGRAKFGQAADPEAMAMKANVTTSGTFNARAALQSGSSGVQERILDEARKAREQRKEANKLTKQMLDIQRGLKLQYTA